MLRPPSASARLLWKGVKNNITTYFILPEPQKKSGEKATPAKKKGGEIDIDGENENATAKGK